MWKITSGFGQQESFRDKPHSGIDLNFKLNEPIYTIKTGKIRFVDYGSENAGKTVFVEWEDGKTSIYGHLNKFAENLKNGDTVEKGQLIGYAGNTGKSTGNHLHFSVKENGQYIDPSSYLNDIQNMEKLHNKYLLVKEDVIDKIPEKGYSLFDMLGDNKETISSFLKLFKANFIDFL